MQRPATTAAVNGPPTEAQGGPPQRGLRIRLLIVQLGIIALFAVIVIRLAQVQIVETRKYRAMAQRQYQTKVVLPAARGKLLDRNDETIASTATSVSFAADPQLAADDARSIAETFSRLFGKPRKFYADKLHEDSRFVWLERGVDASYRNRISVKGANAMAGLVVRDEPSRLYYHDHIAGQLIGTTNVDNAGVAGLELAYETALRGVDGYVIFQRDGLGRARPSVDYPRVDPVSGHSIELTLDMAVQAVAEKELAKGVADNKAEGGVCVILRPRTGEILAIAQCPAVDPETFGKSPLKDQKLRAITDLFEPGSVFKIVTVSAAIENGLVAPDRKFFAENGVYTVAGRPKPIVDTHKEGWITFRRGLEVSSNIVMAKVSDIIGNERFYMMARNYGFGIATNVDFPGESKGLLKKPSEWSGTTLNTMAYGYEVQVTPLQIAAAYAAIANDGVLMQPYMFRREVDPAGNVVRESSPQRIRRVVSRENAALLRDMFVGVVENGTGRSARIPGMRIAGKTGTSRKYVEGEYQPGSYTASFIGFLPADDPKVLCLVMMDNPRGGSYTGGLTSAPVFRAIASQLMTMTDLFAPPPGAVAQDAHEKPERVSPAAPVAVESPRPGSVDEAEPAKVLPAGTVPDVKGCSVRRAVQILMAGRFDPVVSGTGVVTSQVPPAGQQAKAGTKVRIVCQPKSAASL